MIAALFGRSQFKKGDEVILSELEHHSNIVPWQLVRDQVGIEIKIIPVTDDGSLDLGAYQKLFNKNTKMVSISHASNAIGTINPIKQMIALAHEHNVPVMIDGAQAMPHLTVDVQELDCDFYVFSSHKMYGPTGIGVLYAKSHWLEQLPPYQGGGDMITQVTFEQSTYNKLPHKFEAGTPNIADVIGLASAITFLQEVGMDVIRNHEEKLLTVATQRLSKIPGLKIIGNAAHKAPVLSFTLKDIHPHDIGTVLDHEGVAIRAGHHCAMPLMDRFKVPATARASFALYNTVDDVEALNSALLKLIRLFG
jgi:cysteine desulfurase/selenocysteine lyase